MDHESSLFLLDELAACLSEPFPMEDRLPSASALLIHASSSSTCLCERAGDGAMRFSGSDDHIDYTSGGATTTGPPSPSDLSLPLSGHVPELRPADSLAGSRLAQRWLAGTHARVAWARANAEEQTRSFLDLMSLDPKLRA